MKKRILCLITVMIMLCTSFLAGCNLIVTDNAKYYNQVIVTVGDEEITKYQLINAYESYGYQYKNYNGYTLEEALDKTLDILINREVLYQYAKTAKDSNGEALITLTDAEKSGIWKDVFSYVNSQILNYENDIREARGLDKVEKEKEETEEELIEYTPYESEIVYNETLEKWVKITDKEDEPDGDVLTINDFVQDLYGNQEISDLAYRQYLYVVRKNTEDEEKLTDAEVFTKELERLYKSYEKSFYLSRFQEIYEEKVGISEEDILRKYRELVTVSYEKYSVNKKQYISDMQSSAKDVYYHPFGEQMVQVSHILIKYDKDDADYNLKDEYKKQLEAGEIDAEGYDELMSDANLGNNCDVYEIIDGVRSEEKGTAENALGQKIENVNQLYEYVSYEIDRLNTLEEKAERFQELVYQFNQDDGMFKIETYYTVNIDTEYTDTMVEEFANLSRDLYTQGAGSVGICFSKYGAHIVLCLGGVDNQIVQEYSKEAVNAVTIDQLANTLVRLAHNKTLLDVVYADVAKDTYSEYEEKLVGEIKDNMFKDDQKIVIKKSVYSDLYE